jgi:hypothetical protein
MIRARPRSIAFFAANQLPPPYAIEKRYSSTTLDTISKVIETKGERILARDGAKRWCDGGVNTGLQLGPEVVSTYNVARHALGFIIDSSSITICSEMMPGAITNKRSEL